MSRSNFLVLSTTAIVGIAALSGGANAQQGGSNTLCRPGSVVACTIFGKPGTRKCIGEGEYDACQPLPPPPPPPVSGVVFGKYLILTVVYAPPGTTAAKTTTGEQSFSSVNYESDSTTGSTFTISNSFKQGYQISENIGAGVISGGVSMGYANNTTDSTAININKKTSSGIIDNGPVEDAVDHNFDMIWLFLRPKFDVTINGTQVSWTLDPDQSAGLVQFLYAGALKDPSKIPPGVLQDLQVVGITPADYQQILTADPLAECLPPVAEQLRSPPGGPGAPPVPCATPAPTAPRYYPANENLPYDPPAAPGNSTVLQPFSVDNSMVTTQTSSYEMDFTEGVTVSGGLNFLNLIKDTLSAQGTWTWKYINTTAAKTGTEQKASLSMGGPASGYTGPDNMDVYYDTLYMTFAFVPTELSPLALHGSVLSSQGKPVVGQLVTATAGGVKYRTYTNPAGEYHFSKPFAGPIDLQVGSTALHLAASEAGKSVDLHLK